MGGRRAILSVWTLTIFLLAASSAWAGPVANGAEAQKMIRALLAGRTPPLNVGPVREAGQGYEVEVVTPTGTLVDRLLVDKASGRLRSLYGRMLLSLEPTGNQSPALAPGGS